MSGKSTIPGRLTSMTAKAYLHAAVAFATMTFSVSSSGAKQLLSTPAFAPGPNYYFTLPSAPELGPALSPLGDININDLASTVLAVQSVNTSENYLINKNSESSAAQLALQPITVEDAQAQNSGTASKESITTPAPGPAPQLNTTTAAVVTTTNLTSTALSDVPQAALNKALQLCAYSAIPWGQCGGQSACPGFLNGSCADQAWATVCCPPSNGYKQACTQLNPYYWQCLPSSPLPSLEDSELTIIGSTALQISFPHVGPNPDIVTLIQAPPVPPPPAANPPPPTPPPASPPPPLQQTVFFLPPPPEGAGPAPVQTELPPGPQSLPPVGFSGRRLLSALQDWVAGDGSAARNLQASLQSLVNAQKRASVPNPPPPRKSPPPPRKSPPPPPLIPASPPPAPLGPGLLWSDEFDGAPGPSGVDMQSWTFQNGDGSAWGIPGWGNNELEIYTENNALVSDGKLSLTATFDGTNFYSTRLRTFGKRDFVPSSIATPNGIRVEASIQMPQGGQGIWPAFWMLPSDSPPYCSGCGQYGSWPASGEIDIMEAVNDMSTSFGTIHYGGPAAHTQASYWTHGPFTGQPLTKGFHTFAVDWSHAQMVFSVDNAPYLTVACACAAANNGFCGTTNGWFTTNPGGSQVWGNCAPFDRPFHVILNLAVGGGWPGNPTPATVFPQSMLVDYVRVYRL